MFRFLKQKVKACISFFCIVVKEIRRIAPHTWRIAGGSGPGGAPHGFRRDMDMMKAIARYNPAASGTGTPELKSRSCVYLYGIIASRQQWRFGRIGIGGKPLYTICYNDIAAVVSMAGDAALDGSVAKRQHREALAIIRSHTTVLPMEYRENLSVSDIKRILTSRYTHLKVQLASLENGALRRA
jgi:hypothetical protein